ncbi:MAG TPA: GGDEF domain-containing protein [Gallionella sp.]
MENELKHNPGETPCIDTLVKADKMRLLIQQSHPGLFVSLAVALMLCWALWDYADTTGLLIWLGVLSLSLLARLLLSFTHFRTEQTAEETLLRAKPYVAMLIASSLIWGVGLLFVMPANSLQAQVFTLFVLIGMAGGVLATYSAYRPTAIAAMLSMLLPATLWLYFQPDKLHVGMAIGATIFIIVTLRGAKILSDAMHHNFHLGYQLKQAYEQAEILANTDSLTGISNRRAFFERGEQLVRYCERNHLPLSIILMDADHFKQINDTHGHHCGDLTLQKIGQILKNELRKSDVLGRLGGEEFGILLPNTTPDHALILAEKLRRTIAETPITCKERQLSVTASIGIASGSFYLETLLLDADTAMYQAKAQGRNRTVLAD